MFYKANLGPPSSHLIKLSINFALVQTVEHWRRLTLAFDFWHSEQITQIILRIPNLDYKILK